MPAERRHHRLGDVLRHRLPAAAAEVMGGDRIGSASCADDRRVVEERRKPAGIEARRHDENAQVASERALNLERQRQSEIGIEAALVELIEDQAARHRRAPHRTAAGA